VCRVLHELGLCVANGELERLRAIVQGGEKGIPSPVPAEPVLTIAPKAADPPPPIEREKAAIDAILANAANEPSEPPPTPQPRAQSLASIAAYRNLIRRRMAIGAQSDEACQKRTTAEEPQVDAAEQQLGKYRLGRKTRYSNKAPDLGWAVEAFINMCMLCTSPGEDEAVPHECKQALVVLDDLAGEINAAK
jgi:hypothetical protein